MWTIEQLRLIDQPKGFNKASLSVIPSPYTNRIMLCLSSFSSFYIFVTSIESLSPWYTCPPGTCQWLFQYWGWFNGLAVMKTGVNMKALQQFWALAPAAELETARENRRFLNGSGVVYFYPVLAGCKSLWVHFQIHLTVFSFLFQCFLQDENPQDDNKDR